MSDVQDEINALWNGAAADYDSRPSHGFHDASHETAWKQALRALLPAPPADVLDVGCGTGVIGIALADLGYRVRGVDLAESMLSNAQRKARQRRSNGVFFEVGNAIDPPGDSASVDAIVNRHVLWTLTDPSRALGNWLRLLRPGGRLVIIDGLWGRGGDDPLGDSITASLPLMKPSITVDDVRALIAAAGFVDQMTSNLTAIDAMEWALPNDHAAHEPHYVVSASKPVWPHGTVAEVRQAS